MLRPTAEHNPYGTMLDLFLLEAEEMESDQILLISRSEKMNLYFVAQNRIQKTLEFQVDFTLDILDHLSKTTKAKRTNAESNSIQVKFPPNGTGHCVSLIIQKGAEPALEPPDIDSTIKIPAVDFH